MNNNQSNENKSQNELDLGLSQNDSITPRKPVQASESLFDKAKGLFGRKEQPETQFHVRKEPTFGESAPQSSIPQGTVQQSVTSQPAQPSFSPEIKTTVEQAEQKIEHVAEMVVEKAESVIEATEEKIEETKETISSTTEHAKETIAAGAAAATTALKRPEKWKVLQILPEKHRRLFIAILALVLLLIVFFALKPSSDTVESFEMQNSNEIPVQFQSLDQSQPVETTVLDNAPATPAQPETASVLDQAQNEPTQPTKMEYVGDAQTAQQATQPVQQEAIAPQPVPVHHEPAKQVERVERYIEPTPQVRHDTPKPVVQERKPATTQHVKQAEKPTATKTVKAETKVSGQEAKVAAKTESRKPQIVDAKPAGNSTKATTSTGSASKTLTVPQGVSLMQVFRDNNLNISDVNAMTKANGAGNVLSNFKPGDKVQVSVNAQGRVNELRLSNGSRFVRQSDGSYQFKK